ncbi:MAG: SMC family ATPase, partial [Chloroflexi bacterium]|nr:SMC family ATPase [Chloroflexota bacterium]
MIPLKLVLRNFMCYGDPGPSLALEGIHLACLSGKNGEGKSALLDAMTWALWGEARAKSDDDLIHFGRGEMEVEMEFAVGAERYRVLRKHLRGSLKRPGRTLLELQQAVDNSYKSLTGNNLRETQQKLIGLLRMDYDTFINSAFLLQGRADAFTIKNPAERKEVLARILGLSDWDRLEVQAKVLAKEKEDEAHNLRLAMEEIEEELGRREGYEAQVSSLEATLNEWEEALRAQENAIAALRDRERDLERKGQQLKEIEARIAQAEREKAYWQSQTQELGRKIEEDEALLVQRPWVAAGYEEFLTLRRRDEELKAVLAQSLELTQRLREVERQIDEARAELTAQVRVLKTSIQELERQAGREASLATELKRAQTHSNTMPSLEEEHKRNKERVEELANHTQYLRSTNLRLKEDMRELKEKVDLLAGADPRCPLCQGELGIPERERIRARYEAEGRTKAQTYRANETQIAVEEGKRRDLERDLALVEEKLHGCRVAQDRIPALERDLTEAQKARDELLEARARLQEIEARLTRADYAPAQQEEARSLAQGLQALGYDKQKHEVVERRLREVAEFEEKKRRLEEADRLLPQNRASWAQAQEAVARWQATIDADIQGLKEIEKELLALPGLRGQREGAQRYYDELWASREADKKNLMAFQLKLEECACLEVEREGKAVAWHRAQEDAGIYRELEVAFSRKGVQALIIEAALPEIEAEANRLLARMTDNRMGLKMESQRQTQRGETRETLDIKIGDEWGTRPYELYSGGEAFRINFALRIALSKLLARRAGAPLPTLIIDEGFGTQDGMGREKLVEAINAIHDD